MEIINCFKLESIILVFFFVIVTSCTITNVEYIDNYEYVNVKKFGAKGDGKNDDTEAILKAIEFIVSKSLKTNAINGVKTKVYLANSPMLFFPSGIYVISEEIEVGLNIEIKGNNAILTCKDRGKFNGIIGQGWQFSIDGIQFVGFKSAVKLDSKNLDIGKVNISNCSFFNNDKAIELNARSSISVIKNNRFVQNNKAAVFNSGDKIVFKENWISASRLSGNHDAQIMNYGTLFFYDNLLVPTKPKEDCIEPAWINNYNKISVRGVRQGGESGSFTLINNFAKADLDYPIIPKYVNVEDSECYAIYGNRKQFRQPAVLRIINLPNQINISNIRGVVDSHVIQLSEANLNRSDFNVEKGSASKHINVRIENVTGSYYPHERDNFLPEELIQYKE